MEPSAEAVAAGTAAAAAVDEIQSREALSDEVASTAVAAAVAEDRAEDAQATAQYAAEAVSEVAMAVGDTAVRAETAQETAEVATAVASAAVQETQEIREEVQTLDQKIDFIVAHLRRQEEAAQPTTPEVQEVEVHNAPAQPENNSAGTAESGPTRRRAGRLARRSARTDS